VLVRRLAETIFSEKSAMVEDAIANTRDGRATRKSCVASIEVENRHAQ
jgi:hypothetical protein